MDDGTLCYLWRGRMADMFEGKVMLGKLTKKATFLYTK